MRLHPKSLVPVLGSAAVLAATPVFAATNFVINGDFEDTSGGLNGIGQIQVVTPVTNASQSTGVTVNGWTKTCLLNCIANVTPGTPSSQGYAFIADQTSAETSGIPTAAWANDFVKFYDPKPSSNGGKYLTIDGDYGQSQMTQTISSLDAGKTYKLSFEYAGAQQKNYTGATTQKWIVKGFGPDFEVGPWTNPSQGFTDWKSYETSFIPSVSGPIDLIFQAWGAMVGGTPGTSTGGALPPFLLLDNVKIVEGNTPPPPNPTVPGPLPVLGAGVAFSWSRRLRRRLAGRL
ncbi:MAG: hypothetical protein ACK5N0_00320 [Synechococcaceae cyanobacterium]